ncbi:MAG TPA: FAD binding domain-containing protein [Myxococcales bacterium]|nr:FAD binding domain-containing protein [Myxococcales bacterium]
MLTLPPFEHHAPRTLAEALRILGEHRGDALPMAGGTDLVPNLKHRLYDARHVVSLRGLPELRALREEADGTIVLGALTGIAELTRAPLVRAKLPSLVQAAAQVAGPQLREMGTLGGNLCLDTRCVYINQTHFWRQALGYCLKKDGTACHVVAGGKRCVAAASNDTAPVLLSLGARVKLASPRGERVLPLSELYVADGVRNTVREPDEILVEARVPPRPAGLAAGYAKLRVRAAIDYPALSVAVALLREEERVTKLSVVVSALAARPHEVRGLDRFLGKRWGRGLADEIGAHAQKQCHPLTNINVDPDWRRQVLPVYVRRAFAAAGALG